MRLFLTILLLTAPLLADGPEFEVASIKPFVIPQNFAIRVGSVGGPGTTDPTHLNTSATSLRNLLQSAFDVKNFQIVSPEPLNEMFDFALGLPENATKDDVKIMWRNLLISRFGLKYHIEQREFQVDELLIGSKGHKLTENKDADPPPPDPSSGPVAIKMDNEGRPILPRPGLINFMTSNNGTVTARMVAKAQPLSALATNLSNQFSHPVVDKTGLTGKYDFFVEYTPADSRAIAGILAPPPPPGAAGANIPTPTAAADPGVDIATAVQQQLGLRIAKGKGMLDVVIVDKIERTPTEN